MGFGITEVLVQNVFIVVSKLVGFFKPIMKPLRILIQTQQANVLVQFELQYQLAILAFGNFSLECKKLGTVGCTASGVV